MNPRTGRGAHQEKQSKVRKSATKRMVIGKCLHTTTVAPNRNTRKKENKRTYDRVQRAIAASRSAQKGVLQVRPPRRLPRLPCKQCRTNRIGTKQQDKRNGRERRLPRTPPSSAQEIQDDKNSATEESATGWSPTRRLVLTQSPPQTTARPVGHKKDRVAHAMRL